MSNMLNLISDFSKYTMNLSSGCLKRWMASSIITELRFNPAIMDDEVRFLSFLKDRLSTEGFTQTDIELIMGWLYERKLVILP